MTIGGFMPIPLAMMIPFMATQSLVMGESFGKAFQFGKRKMSAMDNESFNKLTIEQVASEMFRSYQNILPDLKQSMRDSSKLQSDIIGQILSIPSETLADLFRLLAGVDRQGEEIVRGRGERPTTAEREPDPNIDPDKFIPPSQKPAVIIPTVQRTNTTTEKIRLQRMITSALQGLAAANAKPLAAFPGGITQGRDDRQQAAKGKLVNQWLTKVRVARTRYHDKYGVWF